MGKRWCCVCGMDEPPNLEVCPASSLGLTHLIAYGKHERAMGVYNSASAVAARAALNQDAEGVSGGR